MTSCPAIGSRLEPKFPSEPGQRLQWRQGRERTGVHDDGDDGGGGGGENYDDDDDGCDYEYGCGHGEYCYYFDWLYCVCECYD